MWTQILTLTMFIAVTKTSHVSKNDTNTKSDVIVTYSGHAEAIDPPKPVFSAEPVFTEKPVTRPTSTVRLYVPESFATETTAFYEDDTEGVLFVPNEKPIFRNGDYHDDRVIIGDIIDRKKTVADIFNDKNVHLETESPPESIVFISGNNNENVEKPSRRDSSYHPNFESDRNENPLKTKKIPLNCTNLDCNNTLKSVCGGKMENRQWRYRVFLNECYFRRVNCDFKYGVNRYRVMPAEFCKTVGSHNSERPFVYNPHPPMPPPKGTSTQAPPTGARRSFSSRRSLNIEVDGSFCSHPCPSECPEDYSPECAVTSSGQRKVFVNHCKLDYNSCSYGTVWHRRPLSDCVGTQKADIRQNRAFIGWMQRVGIVDGKGRLSMDGA